MIAVGEQIRREREERGLSQSALSRAAGVSQSSVSMIEAGDRSPSLYTLERLLGALGLRLAITK